MRRRLVALAAGAVLVGTTVAAVDRLAPPDLTRFHRASVVVTDTDGQLLRPFLAPDHAWRLPLDAAGVDPLYLAMLRDKEDRRFGLHPGIDPLAVVRAAGQWATHGRVVSGASTITMQAARLLEPKPRTIAAKLVESWRALQLQARLGRDGVLGVYLTLAPFGGNLEGVRAGSLAWFGKEPGRLSPAEAALLVALPQSPERLRPDRHPEAARQARDRVLDRAQVAGLLPADAVAEAKAQPVPAQRLAMPRHAPHLSEGLARDAVPGTIVRTHIRGELQRRLEDIAAAEKARMADRADMAIIVVANRDRSVIAHLGSADWETRRLDLSRRPRSPGSALKPFVYALAFDDRTLHPGTLVEDAPVRFGDWSPRNFDHGFHGMVTVREALQRSLNVPAVLALDKVGPGRMAANLADAGATLALPKGAAPRLPLALGGAAIAPVDLAMLYAALSNGGRAQALSWHHEQPPSPARRLVGDVAAWAVLDVLEGTPPPDGLAHGDAVARRPIAYKTGTSYGFRDAWAAGTTPDYTVTVWVGQPDGSSRAGQLGRVAAAPLLFRIFDLLPADERERRRPDGEHALLRRTPPRALERLRPASVQSSGNPPRIMFPPDGAVIETVAEGVALSAQGGRPPLRWLADGQPLPEGARFWKPKGAGFSRLVVVDGDGNRASVSIRVVMPGRK